MKKFFKTIFVLVVFAAILCVVYRVMKGTIEQQWDNLNNSNVAKEKAEKRVSELETELNNIILETFTANQKQTETIVNDSSYLDTKFPSDGNYYVDSYESTFYKDVNCTQPINEPTFKSWVIDEDLTVPNGFQIKALRLNTGELCYCPRDTTIYLVTETEWKEHLEEQKERAAAIAAEME